MRSLSFVTLLLSGTVLAGCSLAPDFSMPQMPLPTTYKEQLPDTELAKGQWDSAQLLEEKDRGQWWKIFGDDQLNQLEQQAIDANQSLKAAAERVKQSRAFAQGNRPSYLPDFDIGGNALRQKPPGAALAAFGTGNSPNIKPYDMYAAQGVLSYEADLFGAVRDSYKAYLFDSQAQDATYRSTLLALQADVAQHYFTLRSLDSERKLLRETIGIYAEAARIMQRKAEVGAASEVDTTRTQSEVAGARAQLLLLDSQRQQAENALAVLLGKMPSDFTFAENPLAGAPPAIPAGLPSELLQRRPDVSAAVANMQAANKRIGVARTAFFPRLILTASGGYQSTQLGDLFDWSSRTWALGQMAGSALTMSVFDSGRNFEKLDASKSAYEESVANYRQQVLVAFKDVEDSLTAQRLLAEQSQQQDLAAQAATRTTQLVGRRYEQGDVDYFQVVDAQRVSLSAERSAVQVQGQRYAATVALVRALGGGWDVAAGEHTADAAASKPLAPVAPAAAVQPEAKESPKTDEAPKSEVVSEPKEEPKKEPEAPSPVAAPQEDGPEKSSEKLPEKSPEDHPVPLMEMHATPPAAQEKEGSKAEPQGYQFEFGMDAIPKEATKEEIPDAAQGEKKESSATDSKEKSDGMFGFSFDLGDVPVVPAGAALKSTAPRDAEMGTSLPTAQPK